MPEEQTTLATLPMGTLLRERYLIKSVLGSGSTGTVYQVKDQQAKNIKYQLFALKEIRGLGQQARYQFTFSGTALRQLQHPALPIIHHIFNDDKRGCVYLVMDYVEGINLETLRQQRPTRRLNWSELRAFCETIAGALTYLHLQEKPLFHGDIKPNNVVQNIAGRIMLLDLGYAQATTSDHKRQISAGTLSSYRAPEQFTGEIDALSDIYGLGATLYELLTGQAPVDALTRLGRVNKKKADPLALASKVAPGVPRPLAEAIQKALALDPAERFQSIKEFWQTLSVLPVPEEAAVPVVVQQKIPSPVPLTPAVSAMPSGSSGSSPEVRIVRANTPRRSPLPSVAILCALLLLLAGAGTWAWASSHSHAATSGKPGSNASSGPQGSPGTGGSPATSNPGIYTNLTGTYQGKLDFLDGSSTTFTLYITSQVQGEFRGNFVSPDPTMQSGTITGTIDTAKVPDVDMLFFNISKKLIIALSGGLNGILGSQINTQDSMGGEFSRCKPEPGTLCDSPGGPDNTGTWNLNFVSSAFIVPSSVWS